MPEARDFGVPTGGMKRSRSPTVPARLLLVFPLLLLVLLSTLQCATSLRTGDAALDGRGGGMDVRCNPESQVADLSSSAARGGNSWNGRRQIFHRFLRETGMPDPPLAVAPGPNPNTSGFDTAENTEPPPPASKPVPPESSHSRSKWYLYMIAGVVVVIILSLILVVFLHRKKMKVVKPWKTGLSGQLTKALVTGAQPLKRADVGAACESFSNIIGSLSDATIYKGTLSSGVEIAVSVIKANKHWSAQNKAQFKRKIALLSKFNHKNFVNLIGYCEENEPFSRMLIFEYAPNGTLFEHLHIRESQDLSWASRLRIAMGVAYCLQYMHHQQSPPIILKNLDSNTIYLTDDFAAKIADMELRSKTVEGTTSTVPRPSGVLQYEMLDKESIVHKFGIVLLELLSGRPPYSDENQGLVNWASEYLKGAKPLKEMIDPVLSKIREEDVKPFSEVIKDCLNPDPRERPSMDVVVDRLRVITGISPEGAAPKLSPLWWAELEIITTEA